MQENKKIKKILLLYSILLFFFWTIYTIKYYPMYMEANLFGTEGAQQLVQVLEILNYRGEDLFASFILFFSLVSFSFLLIVYLLLFIVKKRADYHLIFISSIVIITFISVNCMNKLAVLLLTLVVISLMIIVSLGLTVNYLYVNKDNYENDNLIRMKGPFTSREDANQYLENELLKIKKSGTLNTDSINSDIYSDGSNEYYVEIYLERINNQGVIKNNE